MFIIKTTGDENILKTLDNVAKYIINFVHNKWIYPFENIDMSIAPNTYIEDGVELSIENLAYGEIILCTENDTYGAENIKFQLEQLIDNYFPVQENAKHYINHNSIYSNDNNVYIRYKQKTYRPFINITTPCYKFPSFDINSFVTKNISKEWCIKINNIKVNSRLYKNYMYTNECMINVNQVSSIIIDDINLYNCNKFERIHRHIKITDYIPSVQDKIIPNIIYYQRSDLTYIDNNLFKYSVSDNYNVFIKKNNDRDIALYSKNMMYKIIIHGHNYKEKLTLFSLPEDARIYAPKIFDITSVGKNILENCIELKNIKNKKLYCAITGVELYGICLLYKIIINKKEVFIPLHNVIYNKYHVTIEDTIYTYRTLYKYFALKNKKLNIEAVPVAYDVMYKFNSTNIIDFIYSINSINIYEKILLSAIYNNNAFTIPNQNALCTYDSENNLIFLGYYDLTHEIVSRNKNIGSTYLFQRV